MNISILKHIHTIPNGYSEGIYADRRYGVTKAIFNNGNSFKIYAKELGGTNFISLNYYVIKGKGILKPCEMEEEKVIDFLKKLVLK